VSLLSGRGVKCCFISGEQSDKNVQEEVISSTYSLVYSTPEMILNSKRWRHMLLPEVYSYHRCVFIIDEAHTVKKW